MQSEHKARAIRQAMQLAVENHQTGRLQEAEHIYKEILKHDPKNPDALHFLGLIAHQVGNNEVSVRLIKKAIRYCPSNPIYLNTFGNVLQQLRRYDEALSSYVKALSFNPNFAEALSNRGFVLQQLKRYDEALASYEKALSIKPDHADALYNRGNALRELKRYNEALASFDKVLSIEPNFSEALNNRGLALQQLKRYDEALASFDKALSINPNFAEALNNRGLVLQQLKRYDEALASFDRALTNKPEIAEALGNRGLVLQELGRLHEAEESYRRALALKPQYADVLNNLGNALMGLGRLQEADKSYRRALALMPNFSDAHSNLIFAMDLAEGHDIKEQQAERRRWYAQHGRKYVAEIVPHENSPNLDRKLRIGYVSADFRRHSAYYTFSPVIYAHDRLAFEVYCYSGVGREDDETVRLREAVHAWRSIVGIPDEALAEQIRHDQVDVLVDLSGHSAGNRLPVFARKPAPVQVTAWGYATGTGLETIDYFFADPVLVPNNDRALFAEKVLDLPCVICYEAPAYAPEVHPLPALDGKPFTFGCINRIEKISDKAIGLWGQIMAALPESQLLLKDHKLGDAKIKEGILRRLAAVGITPERVQLAGGSPHAEHLKIYHNVDLGLDPFPHGGGVSTAEALWMGVPVVTLLGQTITSRLSASISTALEMRDWIAVSDADYVRIAVVAARDLPRLVGLRQGLRAQFAASAVGDAKRYTAVVERAYRSMWQRWCRHSPLSDFG